MENKKILGVLLIVSLFVAMPVQASMRCSTNSLGVTTYTDQDGKTTKCRTNSLGVTKCN